MKLAIKTFFTIFLLFTSTHLVYGQATPDAYSFMLSPLEGQAVETEPGGQKMIFEANGVSIGITQEASAYEPGARRILDNIRINITLNTKSEEVRLFTDSVGISFDGVKKYYPIQIGTSNFSLPGGESDMFFTNVPYDMTLFFKRFNRELSSDILDITLHLPTIQSKNGAVLMDAKEIELQGQIQRI